ncbi:MAG TPA: Asp-tRNA(Asn)/Glu-tRNA(Gln) amidotransferase subunit GatC [Parafilimonas sp.]|jgi:aspartyl-tRNA(Asn)/glutamyl-tRNA(Gln) amidotransferase subunit C|nr:Asp-tRNA(Asn)/Glu-tRNA(Gln) amidotransferase subunit GatC [Parafilimonas sp.]
MKITDEMVDHLAHLSRLDFSDEEKIELKQDLEKMIGFVEKLKEVDTTGVEPLMHITDAINILREDAVEKTITKQEALLNAPQTDGDFFIVPKVIKKNNSN